MKQIPVDSDDMGPKNVIKYGMGDMFHWNGVYKEGI